MKTSTQNAKATTAAPATISFAEKMRLAKEAKAAERAKAPSIPTLGEGLMGTPAAKPAKAKAKAADLLDSAGSTDVDDLLGEDPAPAPAKPAKAAKPAKPTEEDDLLGDGGSTEVDDLLGEDPAPAKPARKPSTVDTTTVRYLSFRIGVGMRSPKYVPKTAKEFAEQYAEEVDRVQEALQILVADGRALATKGGKGGNTYARVVPPKA